MLKTDNTVDQEHGMDHEACVERAQLLRSAVLAGDEAAWQTWYDENFDALYAYVLWRSGGARDRADEVVQETWLTAVRSVRRFHPRQGTFLAWLRGLAANVLRHHLRQHGRLRAREQVAVRNRPSDSEQFDRAEKSYQIAQTLAELPERQEAVLRAKYLDGQSVAEIAAEWNETIKAIESLLARARQAFRDAFVK